MSRWRRIVPGIVRRVRAFPPFQWLHRVFSGATWRAAALPLKCLSLRLRAHALDEASAGMITSQAIPGGQIRFFTPNPWLIIRAHTVLTKEADTIRWIDGFAADDVLWDIGANVGVYSLYAAIRKRISVLAFEPSASNYHALTRNIQLNDVSDRIMAYCLAFAEQTRVGILNLAWPTMGAALSHFGNRGEMSPYHEGSPNAVQGMLGFSIDDFVARFNPAFPNHIKLDVDGLELSILEGARSTLGDPMLTSVLVEVGLADSAEKRRAFEILRDAGFELKSIGEIQGTEAERAANHIFQKGTGVGLKAAASSPASKERA